MTTHMHVQVNPTLTQWLWTP